MQIRIDYLYKPGRLRWFSFILIAVGSILTIISLMRGSVMLIAFLKGIPITTIRDIDVNVTSVFYNFFFPFAGGLLLILSGMVIIGFHENSITVREKARGRRALKTRDEGLIRGSLSTGEKSVLDIIGSKDNGILQSDLVVLTGFSKVRVHRILKKLENLGLVKRGRFGITNKVYLSFTG